MSDLTNIKPGDLVAIPSRSQTTFGHKHAPEVDHVIYRVTRRTPKQAKVCKIDGVYEIAIRVSDGYVIGENGYMVAQYATPEIVATHEAQIKLHLRYFAAKTKTEHLEKRLKLNLLTTAQLEALAEAWERIKAMGPKEAAQQPQAAADDVITKEGGAA